VSEFYIFIHIQRADCTVKMVKLITKKYQYIMQTIYVLE